MGQGLAELEQHDEGKDGPGVGAAQEVQERLDHRPAQPCGEGLGGGCGLCLRLRYGWPENVCN